MPRRDRTFTSRDANRFYVLNLDPTEQYEHWLFVTRNPPPFIRGSKPLDQVDAILSVFIEFFQDIALIPGPIGKAAKAIVAVLEGFRILIRLIREGLR